jgi:hypothetical protein
MSTLSQKTKTYSKIVDKTKKKNFVKKGSVQYNYTIKSSNKPEGRFKKCNTADSEMLNSSIGYRKI